MCILDVKFSEDGNKIICGTKHGFIIYKLTPELEKITSHRFNKGVGKIDHLNKTNIISFIGGGKDPYKPLNISILWDLKTKKEFSVAEMTNPIQNVLIGFNARITLTMDKIEILTFKADKMIGSRSTYLNPKGICSMKTTGDELDPFMTIATLGIKKGEIAIWKPFDNFYNQIQAHLGEISNIKLSHDNSLVATASENGTNIHVFNTITGQLIHQLRRGTNLLANTGIHDICISNDNSLLACCSTNGTIHIFELNTNKDMNKNKKSLLYSVGDYLPGYFSSDWSFVQHHTGSTCKMICEFGTDKANTLHVITFEGDYFRVSGKKNEILTRKKLYVNDL